MREDESEEIVETLHELGLSYRDAAKLMSETTDDLKHLKPLWGKHEVRSNKGSGLIKVGVSLIAFPIPTIGIKKSLGAMLIAAGLARRRMQHIQITDVYDTFKDVNKELQKLQDETI